MTLVSTSMLARVDEDVLGVICKVLDETETNTKNPTINALSLTSKRLREHALPYVFKKFQMYCFAKKPWERMLRMLSNWNPSYGEFVREIEIYATLGYREGEGQFDPSLPLKLASTLLQCAGPTSRVEKIKMVIEESRADVFAEACTMQGLVFPNVKCITVAPYNDFIIRHCPNAEMVYVNRRFWQSTKGSQSREHSYKIIQAASTLPKLRLFFISEQWTVPLMNALYDALPTIEMLCIPAGIQLSFEEFIDLVSRFQSTKILLIPPASGLNVGFNPPWCGNAYDGPEGAALRKRVNEEGIAACNKIALQCFSRCKGLQELWISQYSKATVSKSGEIRIEDVGRLNRPEWLSLNFD